MELVFLGQERYTPTKLDVGKEVSITPRIDKRMSFLCCLSVRSFRISLYRRTREKRIQYQDAQNYHLIQELNQGNSM